VIDMDTPGGRLDITEEIIEWIRTLDKPVYVFINTHAQSAGAIISLACEEIYMAPGARVGSAVPILLSPLGGVQGLPDAVQEKMLSDLRAMVRSLAQENGHIPELAEGMVDPDVELTIGDRVVIEKGEVVSLTAQEAVEVIPPREAPLLATAVVDSIDDLLERKDLAALPREVIRPTGREKFADWLVRFAPLFIAGAVIGIFVEFKTPGFGLPGVVGIACLVVFFLAHFDAGLAGHLEIILAVAGILLIAVEIFVLPGFGVAGVLGILSLLIGLVMAMIPHLPAGFDPGVFGGASASLTTAALNLFLAFVVCALGIWGVSKLLPKTSVYSDLVLQASTSVEAGYVGAGVVENHALLGCSGVAATDLRPSGTAEIEGKRTDVVTEGEFIEKGDAIVVKEVHGARIVVGHAPSDDAPGEA
jgi:membrane-bound serine protease (ClpP class)